MANIITRRRFMIRTACALAVLRASAGSRVLRAQDAPAPPTAPKHTLTIISGTPRERGRQYGHHFRHEIPTFLDREIHQTFAQTTDQKQALADYAAACLDVVADYAPELVEELEGVADATGLKVGDLVLMTLHEELYHRGEIPKIQHCTAVAVGPPDTEDDDTYVGQTWDWMPSVFGMSTLVLWRRERGPDLLGYAYPGLWAGAGMNANGIALTWTSASDRDSISGPRVGVPSYLLIAQMLYQPSLDAALDEARRATHAGWFTFVMGDGKGNLANVEGSPRELAIEKNRGTLARADCGTRQMTRTPEGQPVRYSERCAKMYELLGTRGGRLSPSDIERFFLDPDLGIYNSHMTVDAFLFNTTRRTLRITRGLGSSGQWKTFDLSGLMPEVEQKRREGDREKD